MPANHRIHIIEDPGSRALIRRFPNLSLIGFFAMNMNDVRSTAGYGKLSFKTNEHMQGLVDGGPAPGGHRSPEGSAVLPVPEGSRMQRKKAADIRDEKCPGNIYILI